MKKLVFKILLLCLITLAMATSVAATSHTFSRGQTGAHAGAYQQPYAQPYQQPYNQPYGRANPAFGSPGPQQGPVSTKEIDEVWQSMDDFLDLADIVKGTVWVVDVGWRVFEEIYGPASGPSSTPPFGGGTESQPGPPQAPAPSGPAPRVGDVSLATIEGKCVESYVKKQGSPQPINQMPMEHIGIINKFGSGNLAKVHFDTITIMDLFGVHFKVQNGRLVITKDLTAKVQAINSAIATAKSQNPNIKIMMSFTAVAPSWANFIIKNPDAKAVFFQKIDEATRKFPLDGISLDLEHPKTSGNTPVTKEEYVAFLQEIKRRFPGKFLHVYGPKVPSRYAYDIPRVLEIVDYFSIMSYGVYRVKSDKTGPYTPLYGATPFVKKWSLEGYLQSYNSLAPQHARKLIMGISTTAVRFGGVASGNPGTTFERSKSKSPYASSSQNTAVGKQVCLHPSGMKYFNYQKNGINYQEWFEDYETYRLKMNWLLVQKKNGKLGGFVDWVTSNAGNDYWLALSDEVGGALTQV